MPIRKLKDFFSKIHLADRCLLVFMIILMLQSTYHLFANQTISDVLNPIDIMVRTTSAAIFGYFLSVNFTKSSEKSQNNTTSKQQTLIAAIIGLFALCILLYVRNFVTISTSTISTISQMRDFVSGCVGFLLGNPGNQP